MVIKILDILENQFNAEQFEKSFRREQLKLEGTYINLGQHGSSSHRDKLYSAFLVLMTQAKEELLSNLASQIKNSSYCELETLKKRFFKFSQNLLEVLKTIFSKENLFSKVSKEFENECNKIESRMCEAITITIKKRKNFIIKTRIWETIRLVFNSFLGAAIYRVIEKWV